MTAHILKSLLYCLKIKERSLLISIVVVYLHDKIIIAVTSYSWEESVTYNTAEYKLGV